VQRADAICAAANRKLDAAGKTFTPGTTERKFVNEKVVSIFEKDLTEKLDALTPPKGDDARVDAILNAGRQGIDKLRADPEASRPLRAAPRTPSAPRASSRRRADFGAGAAKRQRFVSMAGERGPPAEWRLVTPHARSTSASSASRAGSG